MFPLIKDEHLDYAFEVSGSDSEFLAFLQKMTEEAPGLAEIIEAWTKKTALEYGEALGHLGVHLFREHAGWLLGCLYAAYGKFPKIDLRWCQNYLNVLHKQDAEVNSQRMGEIHDRLHRMHDQWAESFCVNCELDRLSPETMGRLLLLADMFLKAVEEEEQRAADEALRKEVAERVEKLPSEVRSFIEGLHLSDFDKENL